MIQTRDEVPGLPAHGPIACRRCFQDVDGDVLEIGKWRAVNDPGAWGTATPRILILGFSKGFTQANAYRSGKHFENVPFANMRVRLEASLKMLGFLATGDDIDSKFNSVEQQFAFGSLVRCSLSRQDEATGKYQCIGKVMPKAFSEAINPVVQRCASTFLSCLPQGVEIVVMLGNSDAYLKSCRELISSLHPSTFMDVNDVAYRANEALWVHLAHPSGLNGWFKDWFAAGSDTASGRKCILAQQALARHGASRYNVATEICSA